MAAAPVTDAITRRRRRARSLAERRPHAAPLLAFYDQLLEHQRRVRDHARVAEWAAAVAEREREGGPRLDLRSLPLDALMQSFDAFVAAVAPVATEVLRGVAASVAAADAETRRDLIGRFLRREPLAPTAEALACGEPALTFFPHAFTQPIAEALAAPEADPPARQATSCPECGWPPLVGVLRDRDGARGQRALVCALCGSTWPFRRSSCPSCLEADPAQLALHEPEAVPHVRVETCSTCRRYIKSVDLRRDGLADPVVDDIGTVELDIWCADRGFLKIHPNVVGV